MSRKYNYQELKLLMNLRGLLLQVVNLLDKLEFEIETNDAKRANRPTDPAITSIDNLDLSVRARNVLARNGITTVAHVLALLDLDSSKMLELRGFGEKTLDEVVEKLQEKGYWKPNSEDQA